MPERDFQIAFDRAIQLIYDLKSSYLSELLIESDEMKKDLLRGVLSELDEKKRHLYRLEASEIEPFMESLVCQSS